MEEIWHYRVIRKVGRYGVHEVYSDEDGEIWGCSEAPVRVEAESLEDLRENLEYCDYALELPVLEYRDIVPDFDDDELEIEVES